MKKKITYENKCFLIRLLILIILIMISVTDNPISSSPVGRSTIFSIGVLAAYHPDKRR